MEMSTILFVLVLNLIFISPGNCFQWSSSSGSDKVRLTDVSTITLHSNQLTTGRRSSPVPQLQCVGGTAGCRDYLPKTVQCYNRGSDGNDVQWECKAEMDDAYQFGRMQVNCEGYEYPDDPYVLKGSCGLEYELDLTRAGRSYDHSEGSYHHHQNHHYSSRSSSSFGDIIMLFILVAVGFAIYKSCIASNRGHHSSSYQSTPSGTSSYSGTTHQGVNSGTSNGGGFWTGAATGGLLGYLLGNSRGYSRNYGGGWGTGYRSRGWGSGYNSGGWGSGYNSGGWGRSSGGWSSGSRSSGSSGRSQTTSGFGGTSRR